jgi:hypothetical protein
MKTNILRFGALASVMLPGAAFACACGCGVFDVGTSSMFPTGPGATLFVDYDYQNQNQNWSGDSKAPAANNDDQKLSTHFVTLGGQYFFNRSWGLQVEVPFASRYFQKLDDTQQLVSRNWNDLGDIRLKGIYTGFSPDLSSGVSFGLKLPTGSFSFDTDVVDRDSQIGSGSTDVLLGGFHRGSLNINPDFKWFAQVELDVPALTQGSYRPGVEADAAAGVYYTGWSIGSLKLAPVAQIIGSERTSDSGSAASPDNTGYQRILLSPGLELNMHPLKVYGDVEFPVYQNITGNQIVAPALFKFSVSYMF